MLDNKTHGLQFLSKELSLWAVICLLPAETAAVLKAVSATRTVHPIFALVSQGKLNHNAGVVG